MAKLPETVETVSMPAVANLLGMWLVNALGAEGEPCRAGRFVALLGARQ